MRWDSVIYCPAKINLHLEVGLRREDGYHDILSLFHMVDLYDTLMVRSLKSLDYCGIQGNCDIPPQHNLVLKAARLFCETTGIRCALEFYLDKKIPSEAGLGGGSSDAAGTLRLLNRMKGNILGDEDMYRLAATLGSDVLFFMMSPSALVTGRGEKVKPVKSQKDMWCLLIDAGIKVGTAEAYTWLDERPGPPGITDPAELEKMYLGKPSESWRFFNAFEEPVFQRYSVLKSVKEALLRRGAVHAGLTGTGGVVFGIFPEEETLRKACSEGFGKAKLFPVKMLARLYNAILQ
ncbi:MAG: 4-(cytidine 5'-diphospho)-2-C-methyl-D-erythritol kinase [Spirochaetales bacterium]|nr:4-(cytidine 5'-diphospho)-2-C-methyl-D-erythritol kinase [Spirochaetales bacterium]